VGFGGRRGLQVGKALAADLASKWIRSNMDAYRATGHMHEKYDALKLGGTGGGGEYVPQIGFGWSNGVVLDLLRLYPDQRGG
jgi:alpha,alpha-trehalase